MQLDIQEWMASGAILSLNHKQLLIGCGCFEWLSQADLQPDAPAFYFPDFFLHNPKPWIQFQQWHIVPIHALDRLLGHVQDPQRDLQWQSPYRDLFYQTFQQLQDAFALSILNKAVPYIFTYTQETMAPAALRNAIKKAIAYVSRYPSYVYGFWSQNEGMLGVTPELLFSCQGKRLQTMALAGTGSKPQDLSFKDRQEHQLVIEGIQESLKEQGQMYIGETQILELPTLTHLRTPIHVDLKAEAHFEQLVQSLHPTPAVGAFPKAQGWRWLNEYQQRINRSRYGAPAGALYAQEKLSHCLVAIRNVQWDAAQMKIGAGCGVVKESSSDLEWEEIQLKIRAIQELFIS